MGISFHNSTGTPPGSLVVGVGGGVPVLVTEVDESVLVFVGEFEAGVLRFPGVFVEAIFVETMVGSVPVGFSFTETVLSGDNILVPNTTVGGAEISSLRLVRVHPAKNSEIITKK
jgi:hypothetical protein